MSTFAAQPGLWQDNNASGPPRHGLTHASRVLVGDARTLLKEVPSGHYDCCITSPPYWGLRDYDVPDQIGAEERLEEYIERLVEVFREVRRTLKEEGTLWLNIGDSYTSGNRTWRDEDKKNPARGMNYRAPTPEGLKPKDLIGVPWRLAFALQSDGWYLRADNIWYKPNCQPESVKDRPTRSHEYLFLFSRAERYYYDWEAVREPAANGGPMRNKRSVWSVNTEPSSIPHFATFPKALIAPCILASSKPGQRILDPFFGSGTLGEACLDLGRLFDGIELKQEYAEIARRRLGFC